MGRMQIIKIGTREIGLQHRPYFVADIAANHDGSLDRALYLIELAKEAGADAAKFQNFKAPTIVSRRGFETLGGQLSHQKEWTKSVYEVYAEASVPDEWSQKIWEKCRQVGIEYMTTPYDFHSVDLADQYSHCYKIGSGDITWHEMLRYVAQKNKPILLATGASTIEDVKNAMGHLLEYHNQVVLMQCNTNYTARDENYRYINLNVLKTYQLLYPNVLLGLSDHTQGYETVLGAISIGARVIEKHFTDDQSRVGPDHHFSVTPEQWKEMVRAADHLFDALGDGIKRIEENELETAVVQRRGIYYCKDLKKGDIIGENDIFPLRPVQVTDIPADCWKDVVGKQLACDVGADISAKWEDFTK